MLINRKEFLRLAGVAAAGLTACRDQSRSHDPSSADEWTAIRREFDLADDYVHLANLFIASHPRTVREALLDYRNELNVNPVLYLEENNRNLETEVRKAAADYLGANPEEIALTVSTTMGLGIVYNGIRVAPGQEILTTEHDYYSTLASLEYKSQQTGVRVRKIRLYERVESTSEEEIVSNLIREIRPETRVLALTWVHSSTGLKIPIQAIGAAVAEINSNRSEPDRLLVGVDGVHALGVEDFTVGELNCDFFMAGTHKWMFGPRGTGIVWGNPRSHNQVIATIPTFSTGDGWGGWMTPGGFQAFEHRWAVIEAFQFHQEIGKSRVTERIHALCRQLKEGLTRFSHVQLYTPMSEDLSAGIVCFDIDGLTPAQTVARLLENRVIGSETPYEPSHARLTPGIINSPADIDRALQAIRELS
jgi:isopenicillin-N epimerase